MVLFFFLFSLTPATTEGNTFYSNRANRLLPADFHLSVVKDCVFVFQWVLVVNCFCFQPSLIAVMLNSLLKSHWVFQHSHSACVSWRTSGTRGTSFCLLTAHMTLMSWTCGKRKTAICPCIFSLVAMERFSICLLSPPFGHTCVSPGTLRLVLLPSGWMDVAVHYRCIKQVIEFVQVELSCLAKTLIDIWVTLNGSRAL